MQSPADSLLWGSSEATEAFRPCGLLHPKGYKSPVEGSPDAIKLDATQGVRDNGPHVGACARVDDTIRSISATRLRTENPQGHRLPRSNQVRDDSSVSASRDEGQCRSAKSVLKARRPLARSESSYSRSFNSLSRLHSFSPLELVSAFESFSSNIVA